MKLLKLNISHIFFVNHTTELQRSLGKFKNITAVLVLWNLSKPYLSKLYSTNLTSPALIFPGLIFSTLVYLRPLIWIPLKISVCQIIFYETHKIWQKTIADRLSSVIIFKEPNYFELCPPRRFWSSRFQNSILSQIFQRITFLRRKILSINFFQLLCFQILFSFKILTSTLKELKIHSFYSEFQGFRTKIARWLFLSQLWPLLKRALFFEAAGAASKIGSSLKSNHHWQI